jgi:hypothetical protein
VTKVVFYLILIWAGVIGAILFMAATSSGVNDISKEAAASIAASGNMSQMPGIEDAVKSFPFWKWLIPPFVGIVFTTVFLMQNRGRNNG